MFSGDEPKIGIVSGAPGAGARGGGAGRAPPRPTPRGGVTAAAPCRDAAR